MLLDVTHGLVLCDHDQGVLLASNKTRRTNFGYAIALDMLDMTLCSSRRDDQNSGDD